MCLCAPEVQREAEGDCRHNRVSCTVGQPVPAGHQAAHVRSGAQDRRPRRAGPGPISLPGTYTYFCHNLSKVNTYALTFEQVMRYTHTCVYSFCQFTHKFFVCTESLGSNDTPDYKLRSEEEFEVNKLAVSLCSIKLTTSILVQYSKLFVCIRMKLS